jgi:lysophospholipase L1-like esterase
MRTHIRWWKATLAFLDPDFMTGNIVPLCVILAALLLACGVFGCGTPEDMRRLGMMPPTDGATIDGASSDALPTHDGQTPVDGARPGDAGSIDGAMSTPTPSSRWALHIEAIHLPSNPVPADYLFVKLDSGNPTSPIMANPPESTAGGTGTDGTWSDYLLYAGKYSDMAAGTILMKTMRGPTSTVGYTWTGQQYQTVEADYGAGTVTRTMRGGGTITFRIVETAMVILPLGDSITQGTGGTSGYRGPLLTMLNSAGIQVTYEGSVSGPDYPNEGHSGARIDQLWSSVSHSGDGVPDVILLHAGTNDVIQWTQDPQTIPNLPLANAPQRLLTLVDQLHGLWPNATIIVARIIYERLAPADSAAFNVQWPMTMELDQRPFVHVVDMQSIVTNPTDYTDDYHPNSTGYSKMATVWYNAILAL